MEIKPRRPNNYLALAIISTIVCCLPLGIVSIIYSTQVNTAYDMGDYNKAERASNNAKNWGIASIVIGFIFVALYFLFVIGVAASGGF